MIDPLHSHGKKRCGFGEISGDFSKFGNQTRFNILTALRMQISRNYIKNNDFHQKNFLFSLIEDFEAFSPIYRLNSNRKLIFAHSF